MSASYIYLQESILSPKKKLKISSKNRYQNEAGSEYDRFGIEPMIKNKKRNKMSELRIDLSTTP